MLIGLVGEIGSGKTTIANYIMEKYGFKEYSFAAPLKEIGAIFGFSKEQLYGTQSQKLEIHPHWGVSARAFLQKVGTELFRGSLSDVLPEMKCEDTVWIELFKIKYKNEPGNYVVSDVRFLDEALAIKKLGGVIITLRRTNLVSSESGIEHNHPSEQQIGKIKYDYFIDNDRLSLEKAKMKIDSILELL
jgi:hypothetical protein